MPTALLTGLLLLQGPAGNRHAQQSIEMRIDSGQIISSLVGVGHQKQHGSQMLLLELQKCQGQREGAAVFSLPTLQSGPRV